MLPALLSYMKAHGNFSSMLCRQHPWFMQHLPRYLAVMQADTMATSANIDQEMVDEVVRLGFTRSHIVSSLKSRVQNKVGASCHVFAPHTCCRVHWDAAQQLQHQLPQRAPTYVDKERGVLSSATPLVTLAAPAFGARGSIKLSGLHPML